MSCVPLAFASQKTVSPKAPNAAKPKSASKLRASLSTASPKPFAVVEVVPAELVIEITALPEIATA